MISNAYMFTSSLFKVIAFVIIWGVLWLPIAIPVALLINWRPTQPITVKQKLILLTSLYPIAPIIIWLATKIENTPFTDYGLNWQPHFFLSFTIGFSLGIISLTIIFILESILGLIKWQWSNSKRLLPAILPIFILGLGVAITEELVFRGFIFNQLEIDYAYWWAAIISSLIFAFLHLVWSPKETLPQLPGLCLMGMVLVGARLIDHGSLALAIGLHTGWIWTLSCLDSAELVAYTNANRAWLTGINQQPLAGVAGILGLLLTAFALLWLHYPSIIYP